MIRHGIYILVVVLVLAFAGSAAASWSFHIDNDDMDATWEIWLLTDETLTTNGYGLAFTYAYEAGELVWNSVNYTNTPADGLMADFPNPPIAAADGSINNYNAGILGEVSTIEENMQIGTITLTYGNDRQPAWGDLEWNSSDLLFSVNMNGSSYSGAELAAGGHLTTDAAPVPIFGAGWLLGFCIIGLVGLKNKINVN